MAKPNDEKIIHGPLRDVKVNDDGEKSITRLSPENDAGDVKIDPELDSHVMDLINEDNSEENENITLRDVLSKLTKFAFSKGLTLEDIKEFLPKIEPDDSTDLADSTKFASSRAAYDAKRNAVNLNGGNSSGYTNIYAPSTSGEGVPYYNEETREWEWGKLTQEDIDAWNNIIENSVVNSDMFNFRSLPSPYLNGSSVFAGDNKYVLIGVGELLVVDTLSGETQTIPASMARSSDTRLFSFFDYALKKQRVFIVYDAVYEIDIDSNTITSISEDIPGNPRSDDWLIPWYNTDGSLELYYYFDDVCYKKSLLRINSDGSTTAVYNTTSSDFSVMYSISETSDGKPSVYYVGIEKIGYGSDPPYDADIFEIRFSKTSAMQKFSFRWDLNALPTTACARIQNWNKDNRIPIIYVDTNQCLSYAFLGPNFEDSDEYHGNTPLTYIEPDSDSGSAFVQNRIHDQFYNLAPWVYVDVDDELPIDGGLILSSGSFYIKDIQDNPQDYGFENTDYHIIHIHDKNIYRIVPKSDTCEAYVCVYNGESLINNPADLYFDQVRSSTYFDINDGRFETPHKNQLFVYDLSSSPMDDIIVLRTNYVKNSIVGYNTSTTFISSMNKIDSFSTIIDYMNNNQRYFFNVYIKELQSRLSKLEKINSQEDGIIVIGKYREHDEKICDYLVGRDGSLDVILNKITEGSSERPYSIIYLREGNYTLNDSHQLKSASNLVIKGDGKHKTQLTMNYTCGLGIKSDDKEVRINDLTIKITGENLTTPNFRINNISLTSTNSVTFDNVNIYVDIKPSETMEFSIATPTGGYVPGNVVYSYIMLDNLTKNLILNSCDIDVKDYIPYTENNSVGTHARTIGRTVFRFWDNTTVHSTSSNYSLVEKSNSLKNDKYKLYMFHTERVSYGSALTGSSTIYIDGGSIHMKGRSRNYESTSWILGPSGSVPQNAKLVEDMDSIVVFSTPSTLYKLDNVDLWLDRDSTMVDSGISVSGKSEIKNSTVKYTPSKNPTLLNAFLMTNTIFLDYQSYFIKFNLEDDLMRITFDDNAKMVGCYSDIPLASFPSSLKLIGSTIEFHEETDNNAYESTNTGKFIITGDGYQQKNGENRGIVTAKADDLPNVQPTIFISKNDPSETMKVGDLWFKLPQDS